MAARLEWKGARLCLGGWVLAEVLNTGKIAGGTRYEWYEMRTTPPQKPSRMYESITDCMQDLESEVRRLLKEAGIEVEK